MPQLAHGLPILQCPPSQCQIQMPLQSTHPDSAYKPPVAHTVSAQYPSLAHQFAHPPVPLGSSVPLPQWDAMQFIPQSLPQIGQDPGKPLHKATGWQPQPGKFQPGPIPQQVLVLSNFLQEAWSCARETLQRPFLGFLHLDCMFWEAPRKLEAQCRSQCVGQLVAWGGPRLAMSACASVHEQLWQSFLTPNNVLPLVHMCMNMHARVNMDAAGCSTCLCMFLHAPLTVLAVYLSVYPGVRLAFLCDSNALCH